MSKKMRSQDFSYDEEMAPVTKKAKKKKKSKKTSFLFPIPINL